MFGTRSARARDGLRLLMRAPRVEVAMLTCEDWQFLLSHCDEREVRSGWRAASLWASDGA